MNDESKISTEVVKKRITIVLPDEVHAAGKALAEDDRRDFSAQVATLIVAEQKRRKEGAAA